MKKISIIAKVMLTETAQVMLKPVDAKANEFVLQTNRVSFNKLFGQFKHDSIIEITVKEKHK